MIHVMRQFSASDRYVRAGRWPVDGMYPLTRQVSNTKVGIIGLGRIGGAIAKRLSAFGCTISYHNRHEVEDSRVCRMCRRPEELAKRVDVLIVAAAGGSGTRKLVSREVIDALGVDGYPVNIARGSVVDEEALVEALTSGRLAGAGRMSSPMSRMCPRRCGRWTTSWFCRTWVAGRFRRARRWRRSPAQPRQLPDHRVKW